MQHKAVPLTIVMMVVLLVLAGANVALAQNAAANCTSLNYGVTVPHDVLSGLPRAVCEPPTIGIISPRDAASGLPTGK
jgi:hypothetical protein